MPQKARSRARRPIKFSELTRRKSKGRPKHLNDIIPDHSRRPSSVADLGSQQPWNSREGAPERLGPPRCSWQSSTPRIDYSRTLQRTKWALCKLSRRKNLKFQFEKQTARRPQRIKAKRDELPFILIFRPKLLVHVVLSIPGVQKGNEMNCPSSRTISIARPKLLFVFESQSTWPKD